MKDHVRAAVAAIALSHFLGKRVSSIHASGAGYVNIDISIHGTRVSGFDYTNSSHIDGDIPNLYHYGESSHLEFKSMGNGRYEGFDFGESCHFEVTVSGQNASVYDYGVSGYFQFSL